MKPSADYRVISDTVALDPALSDLPQGNDPGQDRFSSFATAGLGVKVGAEWTLRVASESRSHLRIGWGSPGEPSVEIRPSACPTATTSTGWVWYPGGFWVDEPGCYTVDVTVGERTTPVPIALGARCSVTS